MGLRGAVQVDEDARVHAEALARLEGVGDHLQALRGDGEEHLVDDQVALQQLGQVAQASRSPARRATVRVGSAGSMLRQPRTTQPASG